MQAQRITCSWQWIASVRDLLISNSPIKAMSASKQMADLDLEELHNHDVFDFMWEDTALDTGKQMVNKQKRNKKKKKPSLFQVSFRMRNVRPDLTATFRDCVKACNDELYFKQYDYDVAIGCSACDKASYEIRCLTCNNCPQCCDA
ncbi:hypothetical protein MP228_008288 [Amoeboaphelidium protococcarum]|nr:hypothetical protein MP228_008288 [Amoeboaphelidium protococcarum]